MVLTALRRLSVHQIRCKRRCVASHCMATLHSAVLLPFEHAQVPTSTFTRPASALGSARGETARIIAKSARLPTTCAPTDVSTGHVVMVIRPAYLPCNTSGTDHTSVTTLNSRVQGCAAYVQAVAGFYLCCALPEAVCPSGVKPDALPVHMSRCRSSARRTRPRASPRSDGCRSRDRQGGPSVRMST